MNTVDTTLLAAVLETNNVLAFIKRVGIPVSDTITHIDAVKLIVKLADTTSQSKFASFVINLTEGKINPKDLTELLREHFPAARVGDRHGPHYCSLSRTKDMPAGGKLYKSGCRYKVAKSGTTRGTSSEEYLQKKIDSLEAIIESVQDCKNMKEVRAIFA